MQALLDAPATAEREHDLPHLGTTTLGQAIDTIYTADVFLHRWDLARATGQDETPTRTCAPRCSRECCQSGHYGPRVNVPEGADVQAKLLAFIGRTP